MPQPRSRRSPAPVISRRTIAQAARALQQLPPKPRQEVSLQEAIAQLEAPIQQVFCKGYSQHEVVAVLNQAGIPVSQSALQACLGAIAPSPVPAPSPERSPKAHTPVALNLAAALQTPRSAAASQQVEAVIAYLID